MARVMGLRGEEGMERQQDPEADNLLAKINYKLNGWLTIVMVLHIIIGRHTNGVILKAMSFSICIW